MKFIFLSTLASLLTISANADGIVSGFPISKCRDGTVVITSGTTGPTFPGGDPCERHGGSIIKEVLTLDCYAQMGGSCYMLGGTHIIGFPDLLPEKITPQNAGLAHNILLNKIFAKNPTTKEEFAMISSDLMKQYAEDVHVEDAEDVVKYVLEFSSLSLSDQINSWESLGTKLPKRTKAPNPKGTKAPKGKDKVRRAAEKNKKDFSAMYAFIRKVMAGLTEADVKTVEDVLKVTDTCSHQLPDVDDAQKDILMGFLDVLPASFAFWESYGGRMSGPRDRRLAGDWPWETDAVTMCTTSMMLIGFGPAGLAGGVVGGALASAGSYFKW